MKMISFNYQQQESLNESEITKKPGFLLFLLWLSNFLSDGIQ
jgi:hypothetical protein